MSNGSIVRIQGDKKLLKAINKLYIDLDKATLQAVYGTAQRVRRTAIKSIQKETMGPWVKRSRQGGGSYMHVASRPGNAPNTDTGRLVSSIQLEPLKPAHEMYVGTTLEYGKHLEHGTMNMGERPWLHPSLEKNDETLYQELVKAVNRQIKKNTF